MGLCKLLLRKLTQLCLFLSLLIVVSQAGARTIKIATISPDGTLWMQEMRAGAKEVKKRTQGRVVFKFYPGGVMGSDENVLRKIRIGQLQGGAVTMGSLRGVYSDIDIYSLPYLFSSFKQVDYVRERLDQTLLDELEKKGFVAFGFGEGGFTYMMSDSPLYTAEDVRKALPMEQAIEVTKRAYAALSAGNAIVPIRGSLPISPHDATLLTMPAYMEDESGQALATKIVSIFPRNLERGLPLIHAAVMVFDASSGRPIAMLEGSSLTAIRTGAASGAATDILARKDSRVVGIR